jgi:uncharacterized membrane protein YecN with MAPEG domain
MSQIVGTYEFRTALVYVALLILGAVVLGIGVSRQRGRAKVSIGDGGDAVLQRWIRAHGNYCENAPFGIAALILLPLAGASAWSVHLVGLCLVIGRTAHAQGLTATSAESPGRMAGTVLTWVGLLVGAVALLWHAFT